MLFSRQAAEVQVNEIGMSLCVVVSLELLWTLTYAYRVRDFDNFTKELTFAYFYNTQFHLQQARS
jgi:hypothetical protein